MAVIAEYHYGQITVQICDDLCRGLTPQENQRRRDAASRAFHAKARTPEGDKYLEWLYSLPENERQAYLDQRFPQPDSVWKASDDTKGETQNEVPQPGDRDDLPDGDGP